MGKLIIFTAPSGAGKTTIVKHLLAKYDELAFSVSATTRQKRTKEREGRDYYFLTTEKFKSLIREEAFLEWEEVYKDQFYGTLKSEVERLWKMGKHVIFDIDVQGALTLKNCYPDRTLTVFVLPPSLEKLIERLEGRRSESEESIRKRVQKATYELSFEDRFDLVLVNDQLEIALKEAEKIIEHFIFGEHENPTDVSSTDII